MRVFNNKNIVKADSRLFWTLFLARGSLIEIGVKIAQNQLFLTKSIVMADNRVILPLIFSMIPL